MRANEFKFKKTKVTRTVTEFTGLTLDITVAEARALEEELGEGPADSITFPIYQAICAFLEKHDGERSPGDWRR